MKTIQFVAYLFYKYYSKGATKSIPYFSTLSALVMLLILHLFQISAILFKGGSFLPSSTNNTRSENFIIVVICLFPIFLLMKAIIKKEDLQQMHYEQSKIRRGAIFLIIYMIATSDY